MSSQDGLRVLTPGMSAVYLACKRAVKGVRDDDDVAQLRRAFTDRARAAAPLLEMVFGPAGRRLAEALSNARDPGPALAEVRRSTSLQRRRPSKLVLRTRFEVARRARRVARPTGLVVCLAGPDGTGKSTLAERLVAASPRACSAAPSDDILARGILLLRVGCSDVRRETSRGPTCVLPRGDSALCCGSRGSLPTPPSAGGLASPRRRCGRGWCCSSAVGETSSSIRVDTGSTAAPGSWRLLHKALPQADLTLVLDDEPGASTPGNRSSLWRS